MILAEIGKIVSGGQTGADRAALDAAIERGLPHGGWVPLGRAAEDGTIGARYDVCETGSGDPSVRSTPLPGSAPRAFVK